MLIAILAAAHSYLANRHKSATFDEPVHLLSSWMIVNRGDFSINPEHPPLWKLVAGLPLIGSHIDIDSHAAQAKSVLSQIENQGPLATDVLFRADGDGPRLLARTRLVMSVFLALTVLVVAKWSWTASGPVAAIIASILLAFDPNFLAHGSLLTNDVAASFIFALAGYLTWRLGTRWSWKTASLLALTCAAGAGIKFTCVFLLPIVAVPLLVRSMSRDAWPAKAEAIAVKSQRLARVIGAALITAVVSFAVIWTVYGFRAAPTPSGASFDSGYPRTYLAYNAIALRGAEEGMSLSDDQVKALVPMYRPSGSMLAIYWLQDHRLIPQALGYGLTYAAGRGMFRPAFLLGAYSDTGFWPYFPVAIATKTPVVSLILLATTIILGINAGKRWKRDPEKRWLLLCLLSCPAIYLTFAITSNLNIGIRHILPIYPAMYVAAGIALAKFVRTTKPTRFIVPGFLALLMFETVSAYPNYLAFFNRAAGGERGGLAILGDSNLDWGQDLPALSDWYHRWRADHPTDAFYLAYFGSVDPHLYGIDYTNMSPGFPFDARPPTLDLQRSGVVAISATWLQGTFPENLRPMMANLRGRKPIDVINGSIYLYDFQPAGAAK